MITIFLLKPVNIIFDKPAPWGPIIISDSKCFDIVSLKFIFLYENILNLNILSKYILLKFLFYLINYLFPI